eukprot:6202872-Pleurochrysis_carterae.AAC.2
MQYCAVKNNKHTHVLRVTSWSHVGGRGEQEALSAHLVISVAMALRFDRALTKPSTATSAALLKGSIAPSLAVRSRCDKENVKEKARRAPTCPFACGKNERPFARSSPAASFGSAGSSSPKIQVSFTRPPCTRKTKFTSKDSRFTDKSKTGWYRSVRAIQKAWTYGAGAFAACPIDANAAVCGAVVPVFPESRLRRRRVAGAPARAHEACRACSRASNVKPAGAANSVQHGQAGRYSTVKPAGSALSSRLMQHCQAG